MALRRKMASPHNALYFVIFLGLTFLNLGFVPVDPTTKEQPDNFLFLDQLFSLAASQPRDDGWLWLFTGEPLLKTVMPTQQEQKPLQTLQIISTDQPQDMEALAYELRRSYRKLDVSTSVSTDKKEFKIFRAEQPLSNKTRHGMIVIAANISDHITSRHHQVQVILPLLGAPDIAQTVQNWLDLIHSLSINNNLFSSQTDLAAIQLNLSPPQTSWLGLLPEKVGIGHVLAGTTAAGLLIYGARLALGLYGVMGPCGKPLHLCPCTDKMVKAARL